MTDEELPGNANAEKATESAIKPVVTGKVITRKPSLGKRFIRTFFRGEDPKDVWEYVFFDVLVTAAQDMVVDAGREYLERTFRGGSTRGRRRSSSRSDGYTSYSKASKVSYSGRESDRSERGSRSSRRDRPDFRQIVLESRVECDEVLQNMADLISQHGEATLADFYALIGERSEYTDDRWGWSTLQGSGVRRLNRNEYLLELTDPEYLK